MQSIQADHCLFEHQGLFSAKIEIQEPFENLKHWKATKKEPPILCPTELQKDRLVGDPNLCLELEKVKHKLQSIVYEVYLAHVSQWKLVFSLNPSGVYSLAKYKKGELVLPPVGSIVPFKAGDKAKGISLKFMNQEFHLLPVRAASSFDENKLGCLIPYYFVSTTDKAEEVNMEVKAVENQGVKLPLLVSSKTVQENDRLIRLCSKFQKDSKGSAQASTAVTEPAQKKAKR